MKSANMLLRYSNIVSFYFFNTIIFYTFFSFLAIEYVTLLTDDRDKRNDEILEMEKKLVALKIVKE